MPLVTLLFCVLFLLVPHPALAWGIGVHLELGSYMLANLQLLPAPVATILSAWPHDFLYGCVSADITIGKKYTHYLQHCHSWRMGKKVLLAARTEAQQACAYGYLVHLAADTVAHSFFVPFKMVRTFNTVLLKHAYWELRVEAAVNPEIWPLARTLARENFSANDALLRAVLSDTLFSFNTNKRIFNSMMLLNRLRNWQRALRVISAASKWTLVEEDQQEYLFLARQAAHSILSEMEQSPFWKGDPTGERALKAAKTIRQNLNHVWLQGKLPPHLAASILAEIKPRFRQSITNPEQLLELLSEY